MTAKNLPLKMIPFGTVYLIDPELSVEEQRRDLENIKSLNFNTVVLWPSMSRWDGPSGAMPGNVAFDSIDRVMDMCAEIGLKAILELQGQNVSHQEAPESNPISFDSINNKARDNQLNNPEYQKITYLYIKQVVTHFKNHPALLAFDVYNEVGNDSTDIHTQREFVKFLDKQYNGDIKALNNAWGAFFPNFDTIARIPPNYNTWQWSSLVAPRDWQRFRNHNYCQRTREWIDTVHEVDPDIVAFGDVLGADTMHNRASGYYGVNDFDFNKEVDILGLSCYANMIGREWWKVDAWRWAQWWRSSLAAAQGKQTIISEMMTQNRFMFANEGSSMTDQIRLWSYHAIFHSIKGLIYWKYRPFRKGKQVSGRGLTDFDAKPNHFGKQAAQAAAFTQKYADLLATATPDNAGCVILHDHNTQNIFQALQPDRPDFYTDAHAGIFRALWHHGVTPSYIIPDHIKPTVPDWVRVIVIPCNVSVSQATADALSNFVKRGGILFTEARFGLLNEDATLWNHVPAGDLADTLGVEEVNFTCRFNDTLDIDGQTLTFNNAYFQDQLRLADDVEILAETSNGTPALVARTIGQGKYIHCPFLLGQSLNQNVNDDDAAPYLALFAKAFNLIKSAITPVVAIIHKDPMVDVSTLLNEQGQPILIGITNFNDQPTTVRLQYPADPKSFEADPDASWQQIDGELKITIAARRPAAVIL